MKKSKSNTNTQGTISKTITEPLAKSAKKDWGNLKAYVNAVDNPSDILKSTKDGMRRGLKLFRDMETDPQVFSDLQTRRLKVSSFDWSIVVNNANATDAEKAKDNEQAALLEAQIKPVYRELINEIFDALSMGFSVTEMNMEIIAGQLTLPSVTGWEQEEFMFDELWNLMMKTDSSSTFGVDMQRVVLATFDRRKGNKYGRSLLTSAFWPWYFKKHGLLFWFTYIDKFGMPSVVGRYPQGTSTEKQAELLKCCQAIQTDMAVTVPEGWIIELLEAKRSGDASTYQQFLQYCDIKISKVILMSGLVTNESQFQTRAATGEQKDVMDECIGSDALWLSNILTNQVVRPLAQFNYTFSAAPEFVIHYKTQDTSLNEAEKDNKLAATVPIVLTDLYNKYNLTRPKDEDIVTHNGLIMRFGDLIANSGQVGRVGPLGQVGQGGQVGQVGRVGQVGQVGQMGQITEFGEAPENDKLDDLVILEGDLLEKISDANMPKLLETIDIKQTEKLLKNANTYTDAIIEIEKYKAAASSKSTWENLLILARLLGEFSVQRQLEIASAVDNALFADAPTSGLMELFPGAPFEYGDPKAAAAWLKKKTAVKSDVWKVLSAEAKQAAFYVSELEDLRWIDFVKEKMLEALTEGKTFQQYQKELFELSGTKQFHGYMRTSFNTNLMQALSLQKEEALKRTTGSFPFWRYSAVMDNRTRPAHAAMHNYVARFDDPVWMRWTPPVDFNCRCMKTVCPNSKVQAYIDAKIVEWQAKGISLEDLNKEAKFTAISNAAHDKMLKELIDQVRVESAKLNSTIRKAEK